WRRSFFRGLQFRDDRRMTAAKIAPSTDTANIPRFIVTFPLLPIAHRTGDREFALIGAKVTRAFHFLLKWKALQSPASRPPYGAALRRSAARRFATGRRKRNCGA